MILRVLMTAMPGKSSIQKGCILMKIEEKKTPPSRIQWLSDLIRLEIVLWERLDTRLRAKHDLPLAYFESLFFITQTPEEETGP